MSDIQLPSKAKPSRALAPKRELRPVLESAWIEVRDGTPTIAASDSYKLVLLPVTVLDGELEPGAISAEALKAAEKSGRFVYDEYVEPTSALGAKNGVLFRKPDVSERPKWVGIEFPEEPKQPFRVAINAKFLHDIAEALGARHGSVTLTFDLANAKRDSDGKGWEKPIVVEPTTPNGGKALLMPVRRTV